MNLIMAYSRMVRFSLIEVDVLNSYNVVIMHFFIFLYKFMIGYSAMK